jgi:asparaginyl-tRNA synthetase
MTFIELRGDGGRVIQVVASEDALPAASFRQIRDVTKESTIAVRGVIQEDDRAPGGYELQAEEMELLHDSPEWPLAGGTVTKQARIDQRHLYLRSRRMRAILRIRAHFARLVRRWLDEEGFIAIDAPIFTPNVVEERATLFETARFQGMSFLTQSGQLYNEAASAAFGKIYSFGPTFRSEPQPTPRHLAEFWMVEPEIAGADLEDMIDISERFLRGTVTELVQECSDELELLGRDLSIFDHLSMPYERMHYSDAVSLAQELGVGIRQGEDLSYEAERAITAERNAPLFVTHYPRSVKPFYMRYDRDDPDFVLCADLLAPEGYGEVLGGGEREDEYDVLVHNLEEKEISADSYKWYLDLRRFGSMPHAGFGMGFERTLAWICGLDSMDETIPFPRTPHRSAP